MTNRHDPDVRAQLHERAVYHLRRLRLADDTPIAIEHAFYPSIFSVFTQPGPLGDIRKSRRCSANGVSSHPQPPPQTARVIFPTQRVTAREQRVRNAQYSPYRNRFTICVMPATFGVRQCDFAHIPRRPDLRERLIQTEGATMDVKLSGLVSSSLHDVIRTNHKIPLSKAGIVPVSSSFQDVMRTNHKVPLSQFPVGSSVHDVMRTNHSKVHALETALTGFDIDVNDPKHLLTDKQKAQIKEDMVKAGKEWMDHIDNPNHVPINIQININDDPKDDQLANGRPAYSMPTGPNGTWESAVEYKLQHGGAEGDTSFAKMSDGKPVDVIININSHDLNQLNLDPNSSKGKDAAPAHKGGGILGALGDLLGDDNKVDMTSLLAHEFGHGLGIGRTSALDTETGTFNGSRQTTWESLLDIQKSGTTFTGSHAEQEHGGPVVVTTDIKDENYQHFGNSASDVTDPKADGPELMYGGGLTPGTSYSVSPLDVATLQDLGYQTKGSIPNNIPVLVGHPTTFDIHQLVSKL
jgi:hypothetical protein